MLASAVGRTFRQQFNRWRRTHVSICLTTNGVAHALTVCSDRDLDGRTVKEPAVWASHVYAYGDDSTVSAAVADAYDTVGATTARWARRRRRRPMVVAVIRPTRRVTDRQPTQVELDALARMTATVGTKLQFDSAAFNVGVGHSCRRQAQSLSSVALLAHAEEPAMLGASTVRVACDASYEQQADKAAWAYAYADGTVRFGRCSRWVRTSGDAEADALWRTVVDILGGDDAPETLRVVTDCHNMAVICQHLIATGTLPNVGSVRKAHTRQHYAELANDIVRYRDRLEVFWVRGHHSDRQNQAADQAARSLVRKMCGKPATKRGGRNHVLAPAVAELAT